MKGFGKQLKQIVVTIKGFSSQVISRSPPTGNCAGAPLRAREPPTLFFKKLGTTYVRYSWKKKKLYSRVDSTLFFIFLKFSLNCCINTTVPEPLQAR